MRVRNSSSSLSGSHGDLDGAELRTGGFAGVPIVKTTRYFIKPELVDRVQEITKEEATLRSEEASLRWRYWQKD